jgi:hypothetical protein
MQIALHPPADNLTVTVAAIRKLDEGRYVQGVALHVSQHCISFGRLEWQLVRLHGVGATVIYQWCNGTLALVIGPKSML